MVSVQAMWLHPKPKYELPPRVRSDDTHQNKVGPSIRGSVARKLAEHNCNLTIGCPKILLENPLLSRVLDLKVCQKGGHFGTLSGRVRDLMKIETF